MCQNKSLQKKMVELFEEKVSKIPLAFAMDDADEREKAQYPIPIVERDLFKRAIQTEWADLRYRRIEGLVTIDDFALKLEEELQRKEDFFAKALGIIRNITEHPEYTLESVLLEEFKPKHTSGKERLSEEANYFVKCQKVYNALSAQMYTTVVFHPSAPAIEKVGNLKDLIDIYYRKGRF